jgi:hypothetical protein
MTTDANDLIAAIQEFEAALPGWWWSIGSCGLTRDASCGPPRAMCGPDVWSKTIKRSLSFSTKVSTAMTPKGPLPVRSAT